MIVFSSYSVFKFFHHFFFGGEGGTCPPPPSSYVYGCMNKTQAEASAKLAQEIKVQEKSLSSLCGCACVPLSPLDLRRRWLSVAALTPMPHFLRSALVIGGIKVFRLQLLMSKNILPRWH